MAKRTKQQNLKYNLAARYGMTLEEFYSLPNFCQICGSDRKLVIDHDHKTGKVRGRICNWCNVIIGHANDDINKLRLCAQYLRQHMP